MIDKIKITDLDKAKFDQIKIDKSTQVDDFFEFDYSKVVVKKPWGYEYLIYQNGIVAVWILYIKKGCQTSMHCHPNKKTSLVVLAGNSVCTTINKKFERSPGEGLLLDKGVFHSTKSVSEEGSFVMEIETPVNKRDLLRLKDKYGRVGKGYETIKEMSFNLQNYNYISLIQPEVFYNVKKRFGKCSISLGKFRDYKEFKENFKLEGWDAVSILKGKILDENEDIILDVGDTIGLEGIKSYKNICIEGEIEIIVIKRIDNLIKLSDYMVSLLEKEKIGDIFLVLGSTNVHLLDSVGKNTNIRHICTQDEQVAAIAAESYAKLTQDVSVAIISSGSSSANAITGVADAWVDSTPIMLISGQDQSDQTIDGSSMRQLGVQELDIISIVKPITKYAVKIKDPKSIKYHLQKALFLAKNGRPGPVWIDVPIDIQGMNIDEQELKSFDPAELRQSISTAALKRQISETLNLIKSSKRPVILAGNGIRLAKAEKEFLKLIGLLSIPVLTSRRGADLLPESHPLSFGRPGAYGKRSSNLIIQNCDLLISIGSRLSIPQIGRNYKAFAREAKKVIVDIDKAELKKKTIKPDISVNCSAKEFIDSMLNNIGGYKPKISEWIKKCEEWKTKFSACPEYKNAENDSVNSYLFIEALSDELKEGDILTVDGGAPIAFIMQAYKFKPNQRLISATGLENGSFALPASIGACIGSNGKNIICITDDQGFQKNIQGLETITNYALPVKIFILNTKGHFSIRKTQEEYFGGRYVASYADRKLSSPDIIQAGNSYKIPSFKINTPKGLKVGIRKALTMPGPVICEIDVDKNQQIIPRIVFAVKPDGKWIAKPLEDMYPFLNKKELKDNMLIDLFDEE